MIQTWSRESTDTPIVEPSSQWFGSGLGQNGSTSKRGATGPPAGAAAAAGCADALGAVGLDCGSQAASNAAAETRLKNAIGRFMAYPPRSARIQRLVPKV